MILYANIVVIKENIGLVWKKFILHNINYRSKNIHLLKSIIVFSFPMCLLVSASNIQKYFKYANAFFNRKKGICKP